MTTYETVFVRLDGTMGDEYSVIPITDVNADGEEFVTKSLDRLSREEAFEVAATLIYAMNGTAGRLKGEDQFTGDKLPLYSTIGSVESLDGGGLGH